jgi:hypothetical protein
MIVGRFCAVDAEEVDSGDVGSSAADAARGPILRNAALVQPVSLGDVTSAGID